MVLQGDEAQVEACFGPFGEVLILTQDRCMVCAERTTGSELFLTQPKELLGDVGHQKSHFSPLGDDVRLGAR
jgi:hypothetical protein